MKERRPKAYSTEQQSRNQIAGDKDRQRHKTVAGCEDSEE